MAWLIDRPASRKTEVESQAADSIATGSLPLPGKASPEVPGSR
jgi:hypothetical protein